MAEATERATFDPGKITARMLDEAFMEAVERPELARGAGNNVQAVEVGLDPRDHVIDGAGNMEDAVIDESDEVEGTRWYRRSGRLVVNAAGNRRREGRLYSLEL